VRREEQPWQSRATLLLDRRRSAHRGDGTASTFEWAVSAIASLAVHLAGRGYAIRMVDGSPADRTTGIPWSDGHSGLPATDAAGAVLDILATVAPGGSVDLGRAVAAAAHGTTGGLLLAALGRLRSGDSTLLAGGHQPGTRCVALVAASAGHDAAGYARPDAASTEHETELDRLRAAGWEVVVAEPGERLDRTWGRLGLHRDLVRGGQAAGVRR
jgi:uncharacterized protein (DUF58 family)